MYQLRKINPTSKDAKISSENNKNSLTGQSINYDRHFIRQVITIAIMSHALLSIMVHLIRASLKCIV